MKSKSLLLSIVVLVLAFVVSSCLTCETKEYKISFTGKNKGKLTIKYNNIMSKFDSEELTQQEELNKDYNELIDNYIKGDEATKAFPNAKLVSKRLFEENGKLCGEAVYEFEGLDQVKIFQPNDKCPYMYYISDLMTETYKNSNGTKGPDYFPAIYWDNTSKSLEFTTTVNEPDDKTTSLYSKWKANK